MRILPTLAILALLVIFGCTLPGTCGSTVCGSDWQTYSDRCQAEAAGVDVLKDGECGAACIDDDRENKPGLFGTVTYHGTAYADYCQGENLVQYLCLNDTLDSETLECPSGVCNAGVCLSDGCVDSDGGQDREEKGTVTLGSTNYTDLCISNNRVEEYYCSTGTVLSKILTCSAGYTCDDGACTEATCTDTESGSGEYTAGTVTKGGIDYTDYCINSNEINEFYCSGNTVASITLTCDSDYECAGGICVSTECYDDDGGSDKYTQGTVSYDDTDYTDYCTDADSVREYYCSAEEVHYATLDCPDGYACDDGECIVTDECEETDDGNDEYEFGTTTFGGYDYEDYCDDDETLIEFFCDGDYSIDYDEIECDSGYECDDGECIEVDECDDSDDGEDEYEQGTTTYNGDEETDYCYDGDTVTEYYCDGNDIEDEQIDCSSGYECSSGECIIIEECSETDDGNDSYEAGTTTYTYETTTYDYTDTCTSTTTLIEYYCDGSTIANTTITCSDGCSSGECTPPITS
jgi:hypothetical protein